MSNTHNLSEAKDYQRDLPLSSSEVLHAAEFLLKMTGAETMRMSIERNRRRERLDYEAETLLNALGKGWQDLRIDLNPDDYEQPVRISLDIDGNGTQIRLYVEASKELQLDEAFATIEAELSLEPRTHQRDTSRKFERHAGVAFTPEMTQNTLDLLNKFSGKSLRDVYVLTRGKQYWNEEVVRFDALAGWLGTPTKFQKISEIRGDSRHQDHSFHWQVSLPRGTINVTSWDDKSASNHQRMEAELDELLQFQDVHIGKLRYRTGTLTFEMNRWTEERFRAALEMVFRNFALSGATPDQIKSKVPVPDPIIGTAYITREGRSSEQFKGPVEVLEPSYSLEEFLGRVERPLQTLRAVSLGLEGPLANTLNINVNMESNRISVWSTMELQQMQTLIGPLIDGLKLRLVAGQPGVSLTDQPGFLETASKQVSLLAKILSPAGALLTFLGISLSSGLSWALFGITSVLATHPVANDGVFEGIEATALVVDWELERPALRNFGENLFGVSPLPDALDVVVYKNGERLEELSKHSQPPMTIPLAPGKYRIDLDHPNRGVQDASVYVNIATPNVEAAK